MQGRYGATARGRFGVSCGTAAWLRSTRTGLSATRTRGLLRAALALTCALAGGTPLALCTRLAAASLAIAARLATPATLAAIRSIQNWLRLDARIRLKAGYLHHRNFALDQALDVV